MLSLEERALEGTERTLINFSPRQVRGVRRKIPDQQVFAIGDLRERLKMVFFARWVIRWRSEDGSTVLGCVCVYT